MNPESTHETNTAPAPQPKGRYRWPIIIVGLLVVHTSFIIYAATLALGDKSFTVVPNYYDKALNWDKTRQSQRQAADLGWTFNVLPSTVADDTGQRQIVAHFKDANDQPLRGAAVSLQLYHHAHAGDVIHVALKENNQGHHQALAPLAASGTWHFDAQVQFNGETFTFGQNVNIGKAIIP
ncbi:MAG: FixH family protein [Algisphaera sp.]